jgi:hypothetical protein
MNMEAMRYYTNPLVSISNDGAAKLARKTANTQTLFYSRGCVHLIDMNAKIIAANKGRSIDDVILEFHRLRQMKKPHGLAEWLRFRTGCLKLFVRSSSILGSLKTKGQFGESHHCHVKFTEGSVSDMRVELPQVASATNMQRLLMRLKKSRLHDGQDTPFYRENPFMKTRRD